MHIKICCIASLEEMALAIEAGADAVGLVSAMPSGPGVIADATIAEIAAALPASVESYLLTSRRHADEIARQVAAARPTTVQLVDRLASREEYALLRAAAMGAQLVQVLHVLDDATLDEALDVAPFVDRLLLDSGNPRLAVKELGGTGRTHDWSLSARIRRAVDCPLLLAGGLHVDNVAAAIATVAPFGIDVCSGVRTHGALDPEKVHRFVRTARDAG